METRWGIRKERLITLNKKEQRNKRRRWRTAQAQCRAAREASVGALHTLESPEQVLKEPKAEGEVEKLYELRINKSVRFISRNRREMF